MRVAKIAIEEHVQMPEGAGAQVSAVWPKVQRELIEEMDRGGIEIAVLSLRSGGIQNITDPRQALESARRSNDLMAELVARCPQRLQAFASLPMLDVEAAAEELTRSVKQLGLKGALVKGFSDGKSPDAPVYYDLPEYAPFWETVQALEVPFYLHPRYPMGTPLDLAGHPWFRGSAWSFGADTALHALRLMASGLFDRFPKATVVLGHLGETLPNVMWRIDHRLAEERLGMPAQRPLNHYLRNNFYVTTSGNFYTPALVNAIANLGVERVLFAVDFPWERVSDATGWFDQLDSISEPDWERIARTNAEKLLRLGSFAVSR